MWYCVDTLIAISDIAKDITRNIVLNSRIPMWKVILYNSLPKLTAVSDCEDNLNKTNEKVVTIDMR